MALQYKIKVEHSTTIGSREIKFTAWTAKHERLYLSLVEDKKDSISDEDIYNTLIKPCLILKKDEKDIVLSTNEQKLILIKIREKSIGETIEDKHECKHCGVETDIKVKLDDIVTYKESNYKLFEYEGLKITLGDINSNKDKKRLKIDDGAVAYVFTDFLLHIQKVEMDDDIHENISFMDKKSFIDTLPTMIFDKLFESYQTMVDTLNIEYKWKCPKCKKEEDIDYNQIPGFLWI